MLTKFEKRAMAYILALLMCASMAVSYTHLDVYKRQATMITAGPGRQLKR